MKQVASANRAHNSGRTLHLSAGLAVPFARLFSVHRCITT